MYEILDRAPNFPARCLVSGDIDGPFIDLGGSAPYIEPYMYIHVSVGEQIGRALDMVPRAEVDELLTRVAELEHKYAALDRYREAVEAVQGAEKELTWQT